MTVRNAVETHTMGTDLLEMSLPDVWSEYRDNPHRTRRHFAVWQDGAIIGRGIVTLRPSPARDRRAPDGRHPAGASPQGHRLGAARGRRAGRARRRGAGAQGQPPARCHGWRCRGRVRRPASATCRPTTTGCGSSAPRGYVLEQINRISLLDTAGLARRVEPVARGGGRRLPETTTASSPGPASRPDRWTRDLAVLRTRMSTDAPSAGLVMTVDEWDVDRVREHDARHRRERPDAS